jgi:hypothetical protein
MDDIEKTSPLNFFCGCNPLKTLHAIGIGNQFGLKEK